MPKEANNVNRDLQECLAVIQDFNPQKVILFGSRARGTNREDSDIDLMVIKDAIQDKKLETISLYRALWKKKLYPDIVLVTKAHFEEWRDTTNHICNEAALDGKVIYEKVA